MRYIFIVNFLLTVFPYFAIFPGYYNQPYYVVSNILLLMVHVQPSKSWAEYFLLFLALWGGIIGVISLVMYPDMAQAILKVFTSFLMPFVVFKNMHLFIQKYEKLFRNLLALALVVWLFVAAVQMWDPHFGSVFVLSSERIEAIAESGRGVTSLAPEPTHFAIMISVLGIVLLIQGGSRYLGILALLIGNLLALSSTVLIWFLAVSALWLPFFNARFTLFVLAAMATIVIFPIEAWLFEDSRVSDIVELLRTDGFNGVLGDKSANMRFWGLVSGFILAIDNLFLATWFVPEIWDQQVITIVDRFDNVAGFSPHGPSSGYGQIAYFGGLPAIICVAGAVVCLFGQLSTGKLNRFLFLFGVVLFFNQFTLATGCFGLLLAASIVKPTG